MDTKAPAPNGRGPKFLQNSVPLYPEVTDCGQCSGVSSSVKSWNFTEAAREKRFLSRLMYSDLVAGTFPPAHGPNFPGSHRSFSSGQVKTEYIGIRDQSPGGLAAWKRYFDHIVIMVQAENISAGLGQSSRLA